jgi:hypothetical protein
VSGRRVLPPAAAGLALLLAGCGTHPGAPDLGAGEGVPLASAATSATGSATDPRLVLAGYTGYWQALLHAHAAGAPNDPLLAAHATGAALSEAVAGVQQNVAIGVRLRGSVRHRPSVRGIAGTDAQLTDCLDLSRWRAYNARTGKPDRTVNTSRKFLATYTLSEQSGVWKVATVHEGGAC